MERAELPAVVTAGGTEFQHRLPRLCRELETGALVHLVSLQTGRHRGWFDRDKPGGCEPVRVTVYWLQSNVGKVMDDVRDGAVYEIYHGKECRVLGYVYWSAPEWLARLGNVSLQDSFATGSRSGNRVVVFRDFSSPLAVEAEPSPRQRRRARAVLASA